VRSLIDELASERESILTNADRVRGAIALAHDNLSRDLAGASSRFAESVGEAAGRVTASLNTKGEEIKSERNHSRDYLVYQLATDVNELIMCLAKTGQDTTVNFEKVI